MSAIIRMKRHISDSPQAAVVLNCKKRKTEIASASGETSTILKFAGTVSEDTNIREHISKLTKEEAKEIVSKKHPEAGLKSRLNQNREKSQQNRFKIVNCTRSLNDSDAPAEDASTNLTIVDVEKDRTAPAAAGASSSQAAQASSFSDISDEPYVYDLYIADAASTLEHPDSIDWNDLSICDYNDYLFSQPRLVNEEDSEDDNNAEDEDSNDEDNWRNDYPDEEEMSDDESIGEGHMRRAMASFNMDNELSSDEDAQNGFVYSVDADAFCFEDDYDYHESDAHNHGEAYARFKRRGIKDNSSDSDEDNTNQESRDGSFHSD